MREASVRLRVAIDAHAIGSNLGGNERYLRGVLQGLDRFPQHDYFLYVSDDAAADQAASLCKSAKVRVLGHTSALRRLGYQLSLHCKRDKADVLHVQYVAPPFCPPIVVMIHDISFVHSAEWFTAREWLRFQLTV